MLVQREDVPRKISPQIKALRSKGHFTKIHTRRLAVQIAVQIAE